MIFSLISSRFVPFLILFEKTVNLYNMGLWTLQPRPKPLRPPGVDSPQSDDMTYNFGNDSQEEASERPSPPPSPGGGESFPAAAAAGPTSWAQPDQ